jgi:hypothetical protein
MVLLGDVGQRKRILVRLEIVLMSAQDRCMVCDESTIGMEITLGTPLVLLGNVCQVKACFSVFGVRVSLDAR